jgi:hypothetical protein
LKQGLKSVIQSYDGTPLEPSQQKSSHDGYNGKDPNLEELPYCFACPEKTVSSGMKRCSRCDTAWYCSSECQKKHFKEHRDFCKQIAEEVETLERETVVLQNYKVSDDGTETENLLKEFTGYLFGIENTQTYLQARIKLADLYWIAAYDSEVKDVWEKALFHYLEILRLDVSDPSNVRFRVPFILLYLNRNDEAYAFIQYCLSEKEDIRELVQRHQQTHEGDRLYAIEPNCRYRDIFRECPMLAAKSLTAPLLLALAIIKMRIVESHDCIMPAVESALKETECERIQEVRSVIQEMIVERNYNLSNQEQQRDRLLARIDPYLFQSMQAFERTALPGNCSKLEEVTRYNPVPANVALWNGLRAFFRVPGAANILGERGCKSVTSRIL